MSAWQKKLLIACAAPALIMLLAILLRPVWRDEVWALYYTQPSADLGATTQKLLNNVHPPLYFYILYFWRQLFAGILSAKILNIVFIAVSAVLAVKIGRSERRQTWFFLLCCVGSYWLIHYAAEIRPYALMFCLGGLSVLILARLLSESPGEKLWLWMLAWSGVSALNGLTHYFALPFIGSAGLLTGIVFLTRRQWKSFAQIGAASVLAILPALIWITFSYSEIGYKEGPSPGLVQDFADGAGQFTRGIITKLIGSNIAVFALFIAALPLVFLRRAAIDLVLFGSAALTTLIIFTMHLGWQPLIKERAFMVIMPALILLMARAVAIPAAVFINSGMAHWRLQWVKRLRASLPFVIALSPILFLGEYFKDKEKVGEVRDYLAQYPACAAAALPTYYRPMPEGADFGQYYARIRLPSYRFADLDTPIEWIAGAACPVKAIALVLPRGEKAPHAAARAALIDAGLPMDKVDEINFGKNRNLIFVEKGRQ